MNSDGHIYIETTALKDLTADERERVQEATSEQLQRLMSKPGGSKLSLNEAKALLQLPRRERRKRLAELRSGR